MLIGLKSVRKKAQEITHNSPWVLDLPHTLSAVLTMGVLTFRGHCFSA